MSKGLQALKRYRDIPTAIDYDIVEKELKRLEELDIMYSNCVIEGAKQKKALESVKELFDFDFAIRFPTNQPMLRIMNKRTNEYWEIPIPKEKHDLLKEVLL